MSLHVCVPTAMVFNVSKASKEDPADSHCLSAAHTSFDPHHSVATTSSQLYDTHGMACTGPLLQSRLVWVRLRPGKARPHLGHQL